jgi:hypothetical protein
VLARSQVIGKEEQLVMQDGSAYGATKLGERVWIDREGIPLTLGIQMLSI